VSDKPIRLQLSRKKGFNLQDASKAANGLDAVNVARPSKWGNPMVISDCLALGYSLEQCQIGAVDGHRQYLEEQKIDVSELRGKNLACWCKPGDPCHADTLLELANKEESACARKTPPFSTA